ncbi:MAG: type II toxin-antitoxin system Phd/YefM family antitoxin [Alphaproteobacteria bacterium]|nr:type II toxin-antitoxin system Phd/YefM family antitoxin [Alphaproteobacteria bacterium]
MKNLVTSTEAKTNFGALLTAVQRAPVTIEKNGQPIAVMIAHEDYENYKRMTLENLQAELRIGIEQADRGELLDGEEVFRELLAPFEK